MLEQQQQVCTPAALAGLLGKLHDGGDGSSFLPCITQALASLELGMRPEVIEIAGLVDAITRWALDALADEGPAAFPKTIEPYKHGSSAVHRVAYNSAQCRGLLANALLLNVVDTAIGIKAHNGGLDLSWMLSNDKGTAGHKLACLFCYFHLSRALEATPDDGRSVNFELKAATPIDLDEWKQWALEVGAQQPWDGIRCTLHSGSMEKCELADAFVNFANANFGYGRITAGCTQEEIMQMCCPEFNVGMLHLGCMTDCEVVLVHNVRRFSTYQGYGGNFRYAGPWTVSPTVQTILTMDATIHHHFFEHMILRDIRKAHIAFEGSSLVSSGRWGCGAFGGTPSHKIAQQLVAAGLAGVPFHFSTFGTVDKCNKVLMAVAAARPDTATLLKAVLQASEAVKVKNGKDFADNLETLLPQDAAGSAQSVQDGTGEDQEIDIDLI